MRGYTNKGEGEEKSWVVPVQSMSAIARLYSPTELQNTPSLRAGIDGATEARYRQEGTEFIHTLAKEAGMFVLVFFWRADLLPSLLSSELPRLGPPPHLAAINS